MNFKKILSAVAAAALFMTAASSTASADSIGSASIYLADETWSAQVYWGDGINGENTIGITSVTPAEITGDGTYTTSIEFAEKMTYGQVFYLNSNISGADYPNVEMSIVSVKADGKEVQGNHSVQDINDNGCLRINIFDPLVDASKNFVYKSDWTSGIQSVEATFTIIGTGISADEDTASADAENEGTVPPTDETADDANKDAADEGTASEDTENEGTIPPTDETVNDGNTDVADEGTTSEDTDNEVTAPPTDETVNDENTDAADTDIPSESEKETVGDDAEDAEKPSDDKTEIPDTGNAPISPMAAVTALAGVVAFMAKRK